MAATAAVGFNLALQSRVASLVTLLAVLLCVGLILVSSGVRGRGRSQLRMAAPLAMAVAAAVVIVLRISPWVTIPATAVWVGGLVVAGQRRSITASFAAHLADALIAFPVLARALNGSSGSASNRAQVLRGVLAAAAVIVPMALLLASADAVFGQVLSGLVQGRLLVHLLLTAALLPAVAALAIGAARERPGAATVGAGRHRGSSESAGDRANLGLAGGRGAMVEGTIILGSMAALLGLWCGTQVMVALGGARRLLETADLTAAENARQGFFQLVAVIVLLAVVMVGVDRHVNRSGAADRRRFLILSMVIGVESLGLVISSYSRLALYVERFGHTMLRTSVAWFLAWLTVILVILLVAINHRRLGSGSAMGPMLALAGCWVIAFGLFNPERHVAAANLGNDQATIALDTRYLAEELSPDAVPVLVDALGRLDRETAQDLTERLCARPIPAREYGPLGWNRSLDSARRSLDTLNCP